MNTPAQLDAMIEAHRRDQRMTPIRGILTDLGNDNEDQPRARVACTEANIRDLKTVRLYAPVVIISAEHYDELRPAANQPAIPLKT